MAFMRYAKAMVVQPHVTQRGWGKVRKTASTPARSLVAQASEILGTTFDPSKYLLTHCTIVASVDVEKAPGVKLGRVKVGSKTINRKYADYLIKPQCSQYVNNNGDSWSREVLLMSYRTFIGAQNFLEHVQIEEQSKGRIIDAVARDIGDSVYIDILVATDRRHTQLVKDILSGKMGTLSMGCSVSETVCTQCGNVAVDETELCDHIRYAKLNTYYDDSGNKRVIAELCGHPSLGDTGGVNFIEASWVATPAFTGAVLRNILEPSEVSPAVARQASEVLSQLPAQWSHDDAMVKAANMAGTPVVVGKVSDRRLHAWGDDEEGEASKEDAPAKSPLDTAEEDLYKALTDRVKKRVLDDLRKKEEQESLNDTESTSWQNDTVIKEGYRTAVQALTKTASSEVDFVNRFATLNSAFGVKISVDLYRASLRVGSFDSYSSPDKFLRACERSLGRSITPAELRVFLRVGKLLSRLGSNTNSRQ